MKHSDHWIMTAWTILKYAPPSLGIWLKYIILQGGYTRV
jgi:hypothetical protein